MYFYYRNLFDIITILTKSLNGHLHLIWQDVCNMARDEGSCFESHTKYFYDRTKAECMPFEYSGEDYIYFK